MNSVLIEEMVKEISERVLPRYHDRPETWCAFTHRQSAGWGRHRECPADADRHLGACRRSSVYRTMWSVACLDRLGLDESQEGQLGDVIRSLWSIYMEKDCDLVEINPLLVTEEGEMVAADCQGDTER